MLTLAALIFAGTVSGTVTHTHTPNVSHFLSTRARTDASEAALQRCRATMQLGTGENAKRYTSTFTTTSKFGCTAVPQTLSGYLVKVEPIP